jgi:hypothetical protein
MASSGDPSTFTFTMDAFPDYTKFDASKKVFCAIQILDEDAPIIDEAVAETPEPTPGGNGGETPENGGETPENGGEEPTN